MRVIFLIHDLITVPLGVSFLASIIGRLGHRTAALTIRDPRLPDSIIECKPDLVAFGCTTGFHRKYHEVVREIRRRLPDIPVACGGAHATFFPDDFDDREYLDYLVKGEADRAFPELLEALEGRRAF